MREALGKFCGVLLTDGYIVYERFAQTVNRLVHAQCWSHTRRHFVDAERAEPRLVAEALDRIGAFYKEEAYIRERGLEAEAKLAHRGRVYQTARRRLLCLAQTDADHARCCCPPIPSPKRPAMRWSGKPPCKVFLAYPACAP